jgi:hypothetical protein
LETWRITKSKGACCGCGAELAPNRAFFSCLIEEQSEFVRHDYCSVCWEKEAPGHPFCFWRGRLAATEPDQRVDTDLMLEFFDRLEQADTEEKATFRFVLALYLMRRKELKLVEVRRADGGENLVFQRRSSGQKVEVEQPGLTEEQIRQAAGKMGELLNASL